MVFGIPEKDKEARKTLLNSINDIIEVWDLVKYHSENTTKLLIGSEKKNVTTTQVEKLLSSYGPPSHLWLF